MAETIKENLLYSTLLPLVHQVVRFFVAILIARILDPRDFGIIGIASIVIFYSNSVSNFGFSTALINKEDITNKHTNSIFTINFIISFLLALLVVISSGVISRYFDITELSHVLKVLASIFIITSFRMMFTTLLKREFRFKILSQIEFAAAATQSLLVLLLAYYGYGYWAIVIGMIVANLGSTIASCMVVSLRPRLLLNITAVKELINYASWNFFAAQLRLLGNYLDKFIIGKVLGPVELGYYEKATGFAIMPVESLAQKITGVMFTSFSRNQTDDDALLYYLEKSIIVISVICFPVFAGFAVIADYFVPVFLGDKWMPMIPPLIYVLCAYSLFSVLEVINAFNLATGCYKKQILARSLCLFGFCVALLLFVSKGINAVAVILLSYYILFFSLSVVIVSSRLDVKCVKILQWMLPSVLMTVVMLICVKTVGIIFFAEVNFINMLLLVLTGMISYVFIFFLFNFKSTEFLRDKGLMFSKRIFSKILNFFQGSLV
jgi:O-antigen/teichoic acid export membrane protein